VTRTFSPGDRVMVDVVTGYLSYEDGKLVTSLPLGTVYDRPDQRYPGKTCVVLDKHPNVYCYYEASWLLRVTDGPNGATIHVV
jgi:hypothetical protein